MELKKEGYAHLRAIGGLSNMGLVGVVINSNQRVHDITKAEDDPEGIRVSDYTDDYLPSQEDWITIMYLEDSYWHGEMDDLKEIVEGLALTYPEGHPKENQIIKPEEVVPTNTQDPFFVRFKTNPANKKIMEGGDVIFDCANLVDRLIYGNWTWSPDVKVPGMETEKYMKQNPKYEMVLPEATRKERVNKSDRKIEAYGYVHMKTGIGFAKMKAIASIMDIVAEDDTEEDYRIALVNGAVESDTRSVDYGTHQTLRAVFLKLCELPISKLEKYVVVRKGISYNDILQTGEVYRTSWDSTELVGKNFLEVAENLTKKSAAKVFTELNDRVRTTSNQLAAE